LDVRVYGKDYLIITVYTNAQPIAYYFKNEYPDDDISEIISHVEEYCSKNEISFSENEDSNI
jgi:hypothetical protein